MSIKTGLTKDPPEQEQGLRFRKKIQQRAEILNAAMELMRKRGYDQCRMEDIAEIANVSMKTVYNYFPSKQSILIGLLREDRLRARSAYEAIASNPPPDLAEALTRLIHADVGDVTTPQSKKLWRELLAAETRSHEKPGDEFEKTRDIFLYYVREILIYFRKKEELSPRVSIPVAMKMVYGILAYNFREYCATEAMTTEELYAATKKQIKLLLIAWVDK